MQLIWRVLDQQPIRSLSQYLDIGGGRAALAAREASPDEIVGLISSSGLRGRGGAGFPTGTKWKTVAGSRSTRQATTVVVNAAEGEPGTFKDRALLRTNPYRVLEGAIIAVSAMQTDQIRIAIKGTFDREISRLSNAIAEMRDAGWLHDLDVQLVLGPSSYLFGEETALLEVIEGRQPFPRVTPPYRRGLQEDDTRSAGGVSLATIGGDEGPPALVDNVETLANVALIVAEGPDWFRELGTERSPGTIVCTVSGATRRSAVGEVAMGSTLREVIDAIGWGPQRGSEIGLVLAGTANALIPPALLDTPLTYETMRDAGSGLGSAGFIVFDDTTEPAAVAAGVARFLSVESCGQCEHCKSDGLDIAAQLRRSLEEPTAADMAKLSRRIDTVGVGARCNLALQQAVVAKSLLDLFPGSLSSRLASTSGPTEPVTIAPIENLVGGQALLDTHQLEKQPDWSYEDTDSGAAPAARLGDTPVHIDRRDPTPTAPDWTPSESPGASLDLVDDIHHEIDALIDGCLADDEDVLDEHIDALVVAVRTHVDVTKRVLFPMAHRIGDDDGDRLADAAEAQERRLLSMVDGIDRADVQRSLKDIGVAMHEHEAIGSELLAVLRAELDPVELANLADALAEARATSTVSRLYRNASRSAAQPSPPIPQDQSDETAPERLAAPVTPPPPDVELGSPDLVAPEPSGRAAPRPSETPEIETPAPTPAVAPAAPATAATSGPDESALRRMLVGVDGSPAAGAALEWAGRLAALVGAEVVVANIFEPVQAELAPADYQRLVAEAEHRLSAEWTAPLRRINIRHRPLQLTGTPDRLLTATDAEGADLLVVGTRGAGRHAGLHLGSLAHHLAHHTRRPLAIVPIAGAGMGVERIVVGVDGSPGSEAAVRWCADIAAASDAEVTAVCAFDPHPRWRLTEDEVDWRATAEQAISTEWVAPLRAAGVEVRTRIVEDRHPLSALDKAAADEDACLFVVGTRGLGEVGGVRLGRLPLQLVHHTHLPVVLVPPGDRG